MLDDRDNRSFKRYEIESDCEIKFDDDTSCRGKVFDYSDGMSAIFEGSPKLFPGIQADIIIEKNNVQFRGEVTWTTDEENGVRVGFKRVDNLKGSLTNFKLPDVLIGLQRGTRTGILTVKSETALKKIYIENGDMIFASSNNPEDSLGEMLLKHGRITLETYNEASSIVERESEKFGRVLFYLGWKPKEVYLAVCDQIEEIIVSLFTLQVGELDFHEGYLPSKELIKLNMSAANIIYRGIKQTKNFLYIKRECPFDETVLNLSNNPMYIFQDLSLDADDAKILSLINGEFSMHKILSLSPLKDFDTMKTIYAFLTIGLISEKEESHPIIKLPIENIMGEPLENEAKSFVANVESLLKSERNRDYYSLLGVERDASQADIQKEYYRLSRQFHPDRHFHFPSNDTKSKLVKILLNIMDAYRTLSSPEKRRKYDKHLVVLEQEPAELAEVTGSGDAGHGEVHTKPATVREDRIGLTPKDEATRIEDELADAFIDSRPPAEDDVPTVSSLDEAPLLTGKRQIFIPAAVAVVVCIAVVLIFLFRGPSKETVPLTVSSGGEQSVREVSFPSFRHDAFQKVMSTPESRN